MRGVVTPIVRYAGVSRLGAGGDAVRDLWSTPGKLTAMLRRALGFLCAGPIRRVACRRTAAAGLRLPCVRAAHSGLATLNH